MAKQELVLESIKSLGVEPLENRCIVVKFASPNLSHKVARFLFQEDPFYVLQICKEELLIAPLKWTGNLKDRDPLIIDFSEINKVNIVEKGFNYEISISCNDGDIDLTVQQKELASFRNSGMLSIDNFWGTKNWHANNLDATLKELKQLSK